MAAFVGPVYDQGCLCWAFATQTKQRQQKEIPSLPQDSNTWETQGQKWGHPTTLRQQESLSRQEHFHGEVIPGWGITSQESPHLGTRVCEIPGIQNKGMGNTFMSCLNQAPCSSCVVTGNEWKKWLGWVAPNRFGIYCFIKRWQVLYHHYL